MSDSSESNPNLDSTAGVFELEQDILKVMSANNISAVRALFDTPPRIEADMELEHLPDFHGGPQKVKDDDRHRKLLRGQLASLGASDMVLEEPYLSGRRRLYQAVINIGDDDQPSKVTYWLDEQHTLDREIGPALRLRATRNDPRKPSPVMEKVQKMERLHEGRHVNSLGRFLLEPRPAHRQLIRH